MFHVHLFLVFLDGIVWFNDQAVCLVQKEADGKGVNLILEGFPRRTQLEPDADEPWDPYYSIRGKNTPYHFSHPFNQSS